MHTPTTLPGLPQLLVELHAVCPDVVSIFETGRGTEGTPGRRFDVREAYANVYDTGVVRPGDYRWQYVLSQLGDDGPFEIAPWTLRHLQDLAQVLIREAGWIWRLTALDPASLRSRAEVLAPGTLAVLGEGEGEAECMTLFTALIAAKQRVLEVRS